MLQYSSAQLAIPLIITLICLFGIAALVTFIISARDPQRPNILEEDSRKEPRLQQVSILGKWQVSKDSRNQAIYLIALFIIGLSIRLYNLDGFPPYTDEYAHTGTAVFLLNGTVTSYHRAFWIVTIPVYLSYLLFGVSLWAGRLPMVILNMLAIFPAFTLGKKLSRPIAYISAALFTFNPWIIAVSRTVREYAVLPIFFYLAAVYLLDLLNWEGNSFKEYLIKYKLQITFLGLLLIYTFYDHYSILKIVIAPYVILSGLTILKIIKQKPTKNRIALGLAGAFVIITLFIRQSEFYFLYQKYGKISFYVASRYWDSLVLNDIQHWYFFPTIGYLIIFLVGYLALRAIFSKYNKKNFAVLFCYITFAANLIYLTYFLANQIIHPRNRYGILLVYWYLPVTATAIYVIYHLGKKYLPPKAHRWIPLILIILFTNPQGIWKAISYQGGGSMEITGERHFLVEPAQNFLASRLTSQDVLISDVLYGYDLIAGNKLKADEHISLIKIFANLQPSLLSVIEQIPQGWVAANLSYVEQNDILPFKDSIYQDKQIIYYGQYGDIFIWQWFAANP
jgi:hypothetical protein